MMKIISWMFAISLFSYTATGVALFFMQGQMIYMPDDLDLDGCNLPEGVEIWHQDSEQGLLADAGNTDLLVFFHGNADSACDWRFLAVNHLIPLGYDVLVVEFPGYGGDPRTPSKVLIETAIDSAADWVSGQEYDKIVLMGYSLGTGAASIYADRYGADQVILFAPYDSIYNVARAQGMAYPRFLLTEDFDNVRALHAVDAPIVILHGVADTVIPASHSAALEIELRAAGRNVTRSTLDGVGHLGLFDSPLFDEFMRETLD